MCRSICVFVGMWHTPYVTDKAAEMFILYVRRSSARMSQSEIGKISEMPIHLIIFLILRFFSWLILVEERRNVERENTETDGFPDSLCKVERVLKKVWIERSRWQTGAEQSSNTVKYTNSSLLEQSESKRN